MQQQSPDATQHEEGLFHDTAGNPDPRNTVEDGEEQTVVNTEEQGNITNQDSFGDESSVAGGRSVPMAGEFGSEEDEDELTEDDDELLEDDGIAEEDAMEAEEMDEDEDEPAMMDDDEEAEDEDGESSSGNVI